MWESKALIAGVAVTCGGLVACAMMSQQQEQGKGGGAVSISSEPGTLGSKVSNKKKEEDVVEAKQSTESPKISMYFGSQTGKAEEFAKALAAEGRQRGLALCLAQSKKSLFYVRMPCNPHSNSQGSTAVTMPRQSISQSSIHPRSFLGPTSSSWWRRMAMGILLTMQSSAPSGW